MKIPILARISWGVLLSSRILCLATSPAPYSAQCGLLGKVAATMRLQPSTGRVGLDVLERVASSRAAEVTDESGRRWDWNRARQEIRTLHGFANGDSRGHP